MKDKWMNIGYEDDELKPYIEPLPDLTDNARIGKFNFCHAIKYSHTLTNLTWTQNLEFKFILM